MSAAAAVEKRTCTPMRAHDLSLVIDDETWAALLRQAAERHESAGELAVQAIAQFLQQHGFAPGWARLAR